MSVAFTMPKDHIIACTLNLVHTYKHETYYECALCGYEQKEKPEPDSKCPMCFCINTIVKARRIKKTVLQKWDEESINPVTQRGYHQKDTYKTIAE